MFARAVNENSDIQNVLKDAILFKVDCEKGEGIEIAKQYSVTGYPTYIAMNGKGESTDRWIGYEGPEKWVAAVEAAKADRRTIVEKKAAFEAEPTLALAKSLGSDAAAGSQYRNAVKYYRVAAEMDADNAAAYNSDIMSSMAYGARGGAFTIDEVYGQADIVMAAAGTPAGDKVQLALMLKQVGAASGTMDRALPFMTAAIAASEGSTDEQTVKYRTYLQIDHALLVEKNPAKAFELRLSTMPAGWTEDPDSLNNFAWWCFENDIKLDQAQEWALRGVELAGDDAQRANILDTAAEICNALGNCDEALAHIQRAIELDPEKQYFKDQLVKFEKAAKEKKDS